MKIIRKCKDCGYYRLSNPTNYIFKGAPYCSCKSRKLIDEKFPDWCPLEDVPNQAIRLEGKGCAVYCGGCGYTHVPGTKCPGS